MSDADRDRERRILEVIRALGPGEVVSYGDIADVAGYPKLSRLVGRVLATTTEELPWWRVVNSAGRLVPGHERAQAALLRAEEVRVRDGHVRDAPAGRFSRRPRPGRQVPSRQAARASVPRPRPPSS